jgi:hypothetical protein
MKQTKKQREEKQRRDFLRTLNEAAENSRKSPDAHYNLLSNLAMMLAVTSKETDLHIRIDIARRSLEMARTAGAMFTIGSLNKILKTIDENVARKDHMEQMCWALLTMMREGHKAGNKAHTELQNLCDEVKDNE